MSRSEERREALERAVHKLRTRALEGAVDAAIQILENPDSPANARAATLSSVLRANSLFGDKASEPKKEIHEMTSVELAANIERLERDRKAILREFDSDNEGAFD